MAIAAFERFLRDALEEHLSKLVAPAPVSLATLPNKVRVVSVFNTLERAMKGPRFQTPQPKIDRMVDIEKACKLILADIINPSAFIATHGNPGSRTVREMLKQADIGDVFGNIKPRFEKRWGQPIPSTFIVDKLDEVVNRRHVVAHMVNALNITRVELRESLKFLGILSELLDIELRAKVKALR